MGGVEVEEGQERERGDLPISSALGRAPCSPFPPHSWIPPYTRQLPTEPSNAWALPHDPALSLVPCRLSGPHSCGVAGLCSKFPISLTMTSSLSPGMPPPLTWSL